MHWPRALRATAAAGLACLTACGAATRQGSEPGGQSASASRSLRLEGCAASAETLPPGLVHHRALRREDFRGRTPLDGAALHASGERGAQVALTILCAARIRITRRSGAGFEAELDRLRYFALQDPVYSWWNDGASHVSPEWTLRHEQLHFDLAELEARRWNAARKAVVAETRGVGASAELAVSVLQRRWQRHMQQLRTELAELQARYDRETRHGLDLERQTEWFVRSRRALASSRPGLQAD